MKRIERIILFALILLPYSSLFACSILYYIDSETGKIYVVNNEDYWYDVKAYIQIEPQSKGKLARLWYGWDNFAQGGINEAGLFFDAAVTPKQEAIPGYKHPKSNLGDELLANCSNVEEALDFLEKKKIGLSDSHMMFGDKSGKAVVVEWLNGERILHWISDNHLVMTNFLLTDSTQGNYPCPRYESIQNRIRELESNEQEISLLSVGNTVGQAVQPPRAIQDGRVGGTVYTSFINISDMEFVLSYKLSNENLTKLDLDEEFAKGKRRKIRLD